jgi:glycosyltransferase involved in cell wall biosynthesis
VCATTSCNYLYRHSISLNLTMNISAIIPVYNGEPWLAEAIASIVRQSRPVDELIVVDDGSTDNSAEIARQTGARTIQLEKNSGEGAARNAGISAANGDLIAWLDADDMWAANHVETLASLLEHHPQATSAFAAVQRFGLRSELIVGYVPLGQPSNVFWYAVDDWVHTTIGSMTRRDALIRVGGFATNRRFAVDYDLWLRLSYDHLFVCTHEVTSFWRWHPKQQSQDYGRQLQDVYFFRYQYWCRQVESGNSAMAQELGARIRYLWERDMNKAISSNDALLVESLQRCWEFVPGRSI